MRTIDKRKIPPVAGIDLIYAMNYIDLDDVGSEFINNKYTSSYITYPKGGRPFLESIIMKYVSSDFSAIEAVKSLVRFVAENVRWAGFYFKVNGLSLPFDRSMCEEDLITSGFGWCNEQARVLCALMQLYGIPSRLVFASNRRATIGHVLSEVLLDKGWLLIDQSLNFLFLMHYKSVSASELSTNENVRSYFRPSYRKACHDHIVSQLPLEYLMTNFTMAIAEDPTDGFEKIGYHNHFVI